MHVLNIERRTWLSAAPFFLKTLSVLFAVLLSSVQIRAADAVAKSPFALRWVSNAEPASPWILEVNGAEAKTLNEIRSMNWTPAQWQKLLSVRVEQGDLLSDIGLPAMLGTYRVEQNVIRFEPQFPLEPRIKYRASFYPDQLPGGRAVPGKFVTAVFELPQRAAAAATVVRQIYPSASVLPENLLKFYILFSAPMSRGNIYDHIHLRDEAGKDIELPFLEIDEELWDPTMTRLTLFIDPGRIKRGVLPLEEIGPALEEGKRYTLAIQKEWKDGAGVPLKDTFRKTFKVGPPDREPVDPAKWKIQSPRPDTREPLRITFPESLDHALAQRVIRVMGESSQPVEGSTALENEERRWTFIPARSWRGGPHSVSVQTTIEDLAGNNIGKAFEVDLFEPVQRRFTNSVVKLPFEVR